MTFGAGLMTTPKNFLIINLARNYVNVHFAAKKALIHYFH